MNRRDLPKKRQASLNRQEYKQWKSRALQTFGYYPIFQPFKESFLLRNLSGNALRLYIYLGLMSGNETGETWVSIDTMAKYFGKSNRTISNWLKELEEFGLVERFQLQPNSVSHTFLKPYGIDHFNNPSSLQKGENLNHLNNERGYNDGRKGQTKKESR